MWDHIINLVLGLLVAASAVGVCYILYYIVGSNFLYYISLILLGGVFAFVCYLIGAAITGKGMG